MHGANNNVKFMKTNFIQRRSPTYLSLYSALVQHNNKVKLISKEIGVSNYSYKNHILFNV